MEVTQHPSPQAEFTQTVIWPLESYRVPREKTIHTEHHSKGVMEQRIPEGSISMMNFPDEKSLDKIAGSAETHLWKGFVTFGSASADVIAVSIIVWLIKLIIDAIIHRYALHSIYGCDIHLLAAIWNSVTYFLLHFGKPIKTGQGDRNEEE